MTSPNLIRSYRDLEVWKRGVALAIEIYRVTARFPKSEMYGLTSQMRRAAVSIPSNLAEGHSRAGHEFPRFVSYALGSLAELETQIIIACSVKLLTTPEHDRLIGQLDVLGRMLQTLHARLKHAHTL